MANWHCDPSYHPYKRPLIDILGEPLRPDQLWNPDAVLRVEDIQHRPDTQDRLDKAAATQLVFEDAMIHVVDHLLRSTGANRLVLTGGTHSSRRALRCCALANQASLKCSSSRMLPTAFSATPPVSTSRLAPVLRSRGATAGI